MKIMDKPYLEGNHKEARKNAKYYLFKSKDLKVVKFTLTSLDKNPYFLK